MRAQFPDLEAQAPACPVMANWEPTLDELLGEPIIRQLMARDGVTEPAVRWLASRIGERRGSASERGRTAPRASEQRERVKAHLRAVLKRLNERLRQRT